LKPASSKTPLWLSHTNIKAFKILDAQQLRTAVEQHGTYTHTLIIQDWIEGGDDALYMCFAYMDARGQPLVTFTCRKLRQWPPQTGDTCLAQEDSNDFVLQESLRLFQAVHFHGLGFIEFKRDARTGTTLIVEPNIRLAASMALAEASGVKLLYTMYCDMIGVPLPDGGNQGYRGLKWIYLRKDIQSALYSWFDGNLTLGQWCRSLAGRKVEALFSLSDIGPFLYDIQHTLRIALSRHDRKKDDSE
jgi:predicted ATP-grasp superfamily ATP-dependent carboligase